MEHSRWQGLYHSWDVFLPHQIHDPGTCMTSVEKYSSPFSSVARLLRVGLAHFRDCDRALLAFPPSPGRRPDRLRSSGCFVTIVP